MKTLAELNEIRERMKTKVSVRENGNTYRELLSVWRPAVSRRARVPL